MSTEDREDLTDSAAVTTDRNTLNTNVTSRPVVLGVAHGTMVWHRRWNLHGVVRTFPGADDPQARDRADGWGEVAWAGTCVADELTPELVAELNFDSRHATSPTDAADEDQGRG